MSQTFSLSNFDRPNLGEVARLGADAAIGSPGLEINYTDNLEQGDFLYLGPLGSEAGEMVTVDNVDDSTTVTLTGPTLKPHNRDDRVTALFGNQLKIYRAPNVNGSAPADNQFVFLDTINIDFDQPSTTYVDEDGGADYWYKYIYLNTTTSQESSLEDSEAVRGGGIGLYCSTEDIRREAGFEHADGLSDAVISRYRRRAMALINSKLGRFYVLPFNPVPDVIREITILAAAGYLLLKEYGEMDGGSNKDGVAKLAEAKEWLKELHAGALEGTYFIEGALRIEISTADQQVYGWPDDSTEVADARDNGGDFIFRSGSSF